MGSGFIFINKTYSLDQCDDCQYCAFSTFMSSGGFLPAQYLKASSGSVVRISEQPVKSMMAIKRESLIYLSCFYSLQKRIFLRKFLISSFVLGYCFSGRFKSNSS